MKYTQLGHSIIVPLDNTDYSVMALIKSSRTKSDKHNYIFTLYLKRNDIPKFDTMNEEIYALSSDKIKSAVCSFIEQRYKEGFFKHYIDQYEYELEMLDKGIDLAH